MPIVTDDLLDFLSDVEVSVLQGRGKANGKLAKASPREIYQNYVDVIPPAVKRKLAAREATGDRSRVLWKVSCSLLEVGLSPGEVVVLVEGSVWNKFQSDRGRLWADVNKAALTVAQPRPKAKRRKASRTRVQSLDTPLDRYLAVESKDPQWMIEGLWTDRSHGIIAGEPKTRKSYLAIDIALSVATGSACFNHFPVRRSGPVYMVQEEISDAEMRKRLRYIAIAKGLHGSIEKTGEGISVHLPEPVPLYLRNRTQFDLSDDEQVDALESRIKELGIHLLILDPLQLILGDTDENRASEVRGILTRLLRLKERTGSGILIVHHYSKASEKNPKWGGQRMLGSQAFHGWVESALYLERTKERKSITHVEREFRNFDAMPDFEIDYVGGDEAYEVEISEERAERKRKPPTEFERFCLDNLGAPLKAFAKRLGESDKVVGRRIEKSDYVMLAKKKLKATGAPAVVVVKR